MKKYTDFIIKQKKILIALFLLLNLVAIIGITRIELNTDFSIFSPDESIYEDRMNEVEEVFGELSQIIVLVEHNDFTDDDVTELRSIQEALEVMENVTYVQGVAPATFQMNGMTVPIEGLSAAQIEMFYSNFGEFAPLKLQDDVYYSTFTVFISEDFNQDNIATIEGILDDATYASYISGDIYNQLKVGDYIVDILRLLPPLSLLVILLVFFLQMGSIKPTLLSVLPAGVASLWTFGIIGWIGNEVSILTAIVPIFIIVIGSAYGLHFVSHFLDNKKEDKNNIDSVSGTLKLVGVPMTVTTLTSMVGFLSLLSMNTSSINDLAIFSAVGILLAGVATWYVLPLVMVGKGKYKVKTKENSKFDISIYLRKLWGIPSAVLVLVIIVVSLFTFGKINNEFNMLMIYKDSTIVTKNAEKINEVNGEAIPIFVTVELDGSPLTIDAMNDINEYTANLMELDEVNKVVNPYALLNIAYQAMGTGAIPNDPTLGMLYTNIAQDENSVIHSLISVTDTTVRLLVFPKDLDNDTLIAIEDDVDTYSGSVSVTGVQYLMKDLNVNISDQQVISIAIALSAVFLMLVVTLKSIKIAFYSILPIVITVIALYGFLGISGIPLNITTLIIFSITIGVGIDYAVHFSSIYKHYLKEGLTNKEAIDHAYKYTSRPIITNALGISLGLSILMISPLTIHFNISVLMWVSMTVSVIITLTLLPLLFSIKLKKKN